MILFERLKFFLLLAVLVGSAIAVSNRLTEIALQMQRNTAAVYDQTHKCMLGDDR